MKFKKTNFIIIIIALLILILGVGYASASTNINVEGTANAKRVFGLKFENEKIVNSIGVNEEKTLIKISDDKDKLFVNAGDLRYPGAEVEYSVDIVNTGSYSAQINEIETIGLEENSVIQVSGLNIDFPTLKPGEKYNLVFSIKWNEESNISADENLYFELIMNYVQVI